MTRNCCRYFTVGLVPAAAFVLAVLFGLGVLLLPILYTELAKDFVYGVVIDAGSSHTTLYVYRWEVPTTITTDSSTGLVNQVCSCPVNSLNSTSLNSYVHHPEDAPEAFMSCLNKTYDKSSQNCRQVPKRQRKYTPLYLGATAGMRLVRDINSTTSDNIMSAVENALTHSQYMFKKGDSKVISGKQEAVSAWATANYLKNNETVFKDGVPTIGALDLGGASTQISFRSLSQSGRDQEYLNNQTLFGETYSVYARSFLCYGENEAYSRFLAQLVKNAGSTTNVYNPCLFKGAVVAISPAYIYTACVNTTTSEEVFGQQVQPPSSLRYSGDNITFNGTGDYGECKRQIEEIFDFCNDPDNCANGVYVPPPVSGNFTGFSAFFYTAQYFHSSHFTYNKTTGWSSFLNNVSAFCNMTHDKAKDNYGVDLFLFQRCFTGLFVNFVLETGFGFNTNATLDWSVQFTEELDDTTLGWSLGYILEKSNNISQKYYSPDRPYTVVDLIVGIIILSILCVIFVIFFFLTSYACRNALKTRSGYQNI